jgi:hypothetical protein
MSPNENHGTKVNERKLSTINSQEEKENNDTSSNLDEFMIFDLEL